MVSSLAMTPQWGLEIPANHSEVLLRGRTALNPESVQTDFTTLSGDMLSPVE
jgi:hypothetical protein